MASRRRSSGPRPPHGPRGIRSGKGLGPKLTRLALAVAVAVVALRLATGSGPPDVPSVQAGDLLEGRVTHIRDGDTIEVGGVAVRIEALDCPELGSMAGEIAADRMRRAARFRRVSCTLNGRSSYDRVIGTCVTRTGIDLAQPLLDEGFCEPYR